MAYGTPISGVADLTSVAVDCYYPVAEEAIFLIVGLKNIISFGFSYAVDPWQATSLPSSSRWLTGLRVEEWGYKRAIGCFAGIMFATLLLGAPLYLFGKKLRFVSAKWKVIAW
jgi:hypothetical protein